jgi:putative FmdB family regulatory protein
MPARRCKMGRRFTPANADKDLRESAADFSYNRRMPIYEYECRKCHAHVEAFQKVSDKPLTKCRKCGGKLERKISAPAIQFKGSGWYVTDYAGKTTKGEKAESESASETKSESSDTKSDKTEKKSKESSPAKKTSDKSSSPKASSGD